MVVTNSYREALEGFVRCLHKGLVHVLKADSLLEVNPTPD